MIVRQKEATIEDAIRMAIDFRNHSHNVCILEMRLNECAYPKEEFVKKDIDANAGQRIVLQKDDLFLLRLYKVKVPSSGRKYFNYTIEPRDIVFHNEKGEWPRGVPIALEVANLKYFIVKIVNQYVETVKKRYGSECKLALAGGCFCVALGGYPIVPGV